MQFLVFLETSVPGILTLSRVLVTAYFHMQNVTGLSLVAYRFTSVLFLRSEQYWNRWYFLVPICGVVYSFAVISPWWLFNNYTGTVEIRNGTIYKNVNEKAMFTQATISPIFSTFYFLMILLIGVWTTMAIEDRGKKSQSSRHRHFVKKLTRVIVCNSILMSGNLLFLIILSVIQIFYRPAALVPIKSVVVTFTSDMVTLPMPYILFAFDSNVRRILRIDKVPNLTERLNTYTAKTITNYAIS
ncbi:hypothetical protein B9Z55_020443 [Caenorhabditis nigoni]|nr:hypothetical protein B9Z55_020443 [Caenorhabditis nigoni]